MTRSQEPPSTDPRPSDDALLGALVDQSATGVVVCDVTTGRMRQVNAAMCRMTGYSEQELLQRTIRDITHPDDIEPGEQVLRRLLAGEIETHTYDKRYVRKDGSPLWVQVVITVVRDAAGAPQCYAGLIHDITATMQAQEALAESEERFRRMVAMGSDWYWEQDAQFRFVELPGFERRNFSPENTVGYTRWELPDLGPLPEKVWQQHREKLARHEPFKDFVFLRYDDSGVLHYLQVSGEPIFDRDGTFKGYRGIGNDATAQVGAMKALEASEARYRKLFDVHPYPMWVVDAKTFAFLAVNDAAVKLYGYSKAEFLAMTADQIRPTEDVSRFLRAFEDRSHAYRHRVWRHVKKSGDLIDVEITSFNLEFDGRPARLGVINDITDRLKAEERARDIELRYDALMKSRKRSPSAARTIAARGADRHLRPKRRPPAQLKTRKRARRP
jgi:PAS domain S-box-containing protein